MKGLLIDTNAYSSLKRSTELATLFEHAPLLAMNAIVLGELYFGFSLGNREEQNRLELIEFIDACAVQILDIDADTSVRYSTLMKSLRQAGTPLPTNDVWIAASALQHGYHIVSFDMHFRAISSLQTGTKITDFPE